MARESAMRQTQRDWYFRVGEDRTLTFIRTNMYVVSVLAQAEYALNPRRQEPSIGAASGGVRMVQVAFRPRELARRVQTRRQGGSWPQPGDPLRGAAPDKIQRAAVEATAQAGELDRVGVGTRIDTERLTIEDSVSAVLRQAEIGSGT